MFTRIYVTVISWDADKNHASNSLLHGISENMFDHCGFYYLCSEITVYEFFFFFQEIVLKKIIFFVLN